MNVREIKTILELHEEYLVDNTEGNCANLRCADLEGADLRYADLKGADLTNTILEGLQL